MEQVWRDIESTLTQLYTMTHNQLSLKERGSTPEKEVTKKLNEIRTGINGVPKKNVFHGPKLFLRVVGQHNRVYSGEWWFDADILKYLESSYSRTYFDDHELRDVIRVMLREFLALSNEWNSMDEIWALHLPPGQSLIGYSGIGTPQKLFANKPLSSKGNRMLTGRAQHIYFPFKNPLWVTKLRQLN